jgi:hypothetical protein
MTHVYTGTSWPSTTALSIPPASLRPCASSSCDANMPSTPKKHRYGSHAFFRSALHCSSRRDLCGGAADVSHGRRQGQHVMVYTNSVHSGVVCVWAPRARGLVLVVGDGDGE